MSLVSVEYTFDNSKLIFYFTCESRVDFRELVKDLASTFKTRIELRQIGIRDEAKMMGGLGICGRKFCCSGFLTDFVQVSIKMAKEQNFSLNSAKVSGACGRLMCCLRYEHEVYDEALKKTPPCGSTVSTSDGVGTVVEIKPLAEEVRVKLNDNEKDAAKFYKCDSIKVLRMPGKKDDADNEALSEE
jgi:cell fate regulator YaaT (PSP1 superfamily)